MHPTGKRFIGPALNRDSSLEEKIQVAIELFTVLKGRSPSQEELEDLQKHLKAKAFADRNGKKRP